MTYYFRILRDRTEEAGALEVRFWSDAVSEEAAAIQRDPSGVIVRCYTDLNIAIPAPIPRGLTRDAYILKFATQVLPP